MSARVVTVIDVGGDYSSLNAAFVGEIGDLTSGGLNRQLTINCYNFVDSTAADTGAGWTTDSTHTVLIQAIDNHGGIFGGTGGTSAYRRTGTGSKINSYIAYAIYRGLSITSSVFTPFSTQAAATLTRLERCILSSTSGDQAAVFSGTTHVEHCIIKGQVSDTYGINALADTSVYNTTIVSANRGILAGAVVLAKNVLASGNSLDFNAAGGSFDAASTNNASSDISAPGSNARISQTFTFVNSGANDYHLATTDTGASGYGADLRSDALYPVTVDVDSRSIAPPFNIGADQNAYSANDVILRFVPYPTDSNPNDVRLYTPGTADVGYMAVATSAESSSDATMAERISVAIGSTAEQSSAATVVTHVSLAIAASAEASSSATSSEHINIVAQAPGGSYNEQSSAATIAEHISAAITTSTEAYSDVVGVEREADTIATSAEAYSAAAITVTNPPPVSIAIATSTEASSAATIGIPIPESTGPEQGRGGHFYDPYPPLLQRLTVRVASDAPAVTTDAVMGVRIPAPPPPPKIHIGMRVASRIGAPQSVSSYRTRIGATVTSNIEVGSDSAFEETLHLSGLEYDQRVQEWEDESFVMQVALDLLEV